jgi:phospholipid/cholesterol/gamma-HCH transport system substrate-binding protein
LESKSNYTIIGLSVLFLAASLLSASLWLSVGFDRKIYHSFIVYMDEPVSGLNNESPVKYNGVKVGFVSDIALSTVDPQRVQLMLKIEEGTPITINTRATLISQGITGTTYLGLTATSASLIPLQKTPNEPYPVIPYKPSFYFILEKNINRLSEQVNHMFNKENTQNINQTLAHLEKITSTIAKNSESLNQSFRDLPRLITAIEHSTAKFNTMADDVSVAGTQFTKTMKAGKNSLDQLSQQTIPAIVILLRRLDNISSNFEMVSQKMRQNPAVLLRGTTPPQNGPGE